jgi:hypothetical protein
MARPWSRKRREQARQERPEPEPPARERNEGVLDDDSHAWWANAEVEDVWKPRQAQKAEDPKERDILAEHFGDDWRTNFLHTPPTDDELEEERRREQQALDDQDPYKVLQVEETATWDEIVAAHRHLARVHHPDRLFGQSEEEKAEGEDRIRVINQAYQELRVRRGM